MEKKTKTAGTLSYCISVWNEVWWQFWILHVQVLLLQYMFHRHQFQSSQHFLKFSTESDSLRSSRWIATFGTVKDMGVEPKIGGKPPNPWNLNDGFSMKFSPSILEVFTLFFGWFNTHISETTTCGRTPPHVFWIQIVKIEGDSTWWIWTQQTRLDILGGCFRWEHPRGDHDSDVVRFCSGNFLEFKQKGAGFYTPEN